MSSVLKRLRPARPLLEPLVGVVFLLLWINAEVGRMHAPGFFVAAGLYAVAIALSRLVPAVAIGIVAGVPVLQLIGLLGAPESTTWPIALAVLVVAFEAGGVGRARIRWWGLGAGALNAVVLAIVLVFVGDWLSWTGYGADGFGQMLLPGLDQGAGRTADAVQAAAQLAVTWAVLYGAVWLAGYALNLGSRRRAERQLLDETEVELAVAAAELQREQERTGIAQEVHDVLAHSLAVVIAVADGTRFLRAARPEPTDAQAGRGGDSGIAERTDEALREIADAARTALIDLRGLLESLQDAGPGTEPGLDASGGRGRPQPSLDDLEALVDRVTATGMRVSLDHFGESAPLSPAQELAVYRIVQESLTNALKHGGEHPVAAVSFAWEGEGLGLTVVTSGGRAAPDAAAGAARDGGSAASDGSEARRSSGVAGGPARGGFGIRGMRDRARLAGGWLSAGWDRSEPTGGEPQFIVTAFIPSAAARSEQAA